MIRIECKLLGNAKYNDSDLYVGPYILSNKACPAISLLAIIMLCVNDTRFIHEIMQ